MRPIPQFPANLVTFSEEIHNRKLHFLFSDFFKNDGNTLAMCEICSKLTIKTSERRRSLVKFELISPIASLFTLLKLNK